MRKITAEHLNSLLLPGISKLFKKNELTTGNVYATQVYIRINNFQILLIALGEDLFHRLLSRFFLRVHILSAKYYGFFSIETPNKISIIFGIRKDDVKDNAFFPQKSLFFCTELQKELKFINSWLKENVHTHYNKIRNQYLRLPLEERVKFDINELNMDIGVGVATSEQSSHRDIDRMRMMKVGSEISVSYGAYGGVPYLSKKLCGLASPQHIVVCENTVLENEWLFSFKEQHNVSVGIYGNARAFNINHTKSNNEIFFINKFIRDNLSEKEEGHITDIISNLYAGHVVHNEVKHNMANIKLTITEFESFQGLWMGSTVNGILLYLISGLLGFDQEKKIPLAILGAWYYFLNCDNSYLTLDETYELLDQIPKPYQGYDYKNVLSDLTSKKPTGRDAVLIKSVHEFDRYFFSHNFNSAGTLRADFEGIKSKIVYSENPFTEEIYNIITKVLTE